MSDWKAVWAEAIGAAQAAVGRTAPAGVAYVKEIAAGHERTLAMLLAALAEGALDAETFDAELREEKKVLAAELLAVQVIAKKAAQDGANALMRTIEKALVRGITALV